MCDPSFFIRPLSPVPIPWVTSPKRHKIVYGDHLLSVQRIVDAGEACSRPKSRFKKDNFAIVFKASIE